MPDPQPRINPYPQIKILTEARKHARTRRTARKRSAMHTSELKDKRGRDTMAADSNWCIQHLLNRLHARDIFSTGFVQRDALLVLLSGLQRHVEERLAKAVIERMAGRRALAHDPPLRDMNELPLPVHS